MTGRRWRVTRPSAAPLSRRAVLTGAAAWTGAVALSGCAAGGPPVPAGRPRPWSRWAATTPGGRLRIDHGPYETLIRTYSHMRSDDVRLFAYGEVTSAEQETLDDYIRVLTSLAPTRLDRREQYAYWLNLHNALVIRLVIRGYLVLSVRDVELGPGPIKRGPWSRKLVSVEGEPIALEDIRDRILRPLWQDPRLHYGLYLAAVGAPNLPLHAFTAGNLDSQLEDAAAAYVNHPRGARFEDGQQVLSSLYDWYLADFGGTLQGVVAHLRLYATPPLSDILSAGWPTRHAFDWSLNDATGLPR